jgi:hypothetical protein
MLGRAAEPEPADVRPAHLTAILTARGAGIRLAYVAHPATPAADAETENDALQQKGPVSRAFLSSGGRI